MNAFSRLLNRLGTIAGRSHAAPKPLGAGRKRRLCCRVQRLEQLEERALLSIGAVGAQDESPLALAAADQEAASSAAEPLISMEGTSDHGRRVVALDAIEAPASSSSPVEAWQTIFSDDFEGAFPGSWSLYGTPTWGDESYTANSGSWSAYCVGSTVAPPGPYPINTNSWLYYGPFSLADATDAKLDFAYRNNSELNYDFFAWAASIDDLSYSGYQVSGNQSTWTPQTFDLKTVPTLGNLCGQSQVWIAFIFQSDGSINYEGAYVDDVVLSKDAPGTQNGQIEGRKWNDLDGDGNVGESGETGLEGWTIFVDENQNGEWDGAGVEDLYDVTDVNGDYAIADVPPGDYWVGEVQQSGWDQTFPNGGGGGDFRLLSGTGSGGPNPFSLVELQTGPVAEVLIGASSYNPGLDIDPTTGQLYGASDSLRIVNSANGSYTTIGSIDSATQTDILMGSIAFDPSGSLYGVSSADQKLYTINKSTAFATEVGTLSDTAWGIDFAPDGTLYAAYSNLYVLDPATANTVSTVGSLGGPYVVDIDYAPDGMIYGVYHDNRTLYEINPANASTSALGVYDSDIWGVASEPLSGPTAPAPGATDSTFDLASAIEAESALIAALPAAPEVAFMVANSPPTAPSDTSYTVVDTIPPAAVMLSEVPASRWTFGCTATSAGMIFGYYDRGSYPDMYTGPANAGVAPLVNLGQGIPTDSDYPIPGSCSIIATDNGFDGRVTDGHVEDYWIAYNALGPDPWEPGGVEHAWGDCTADYLGTNQWKWDFDSNGSTESNVDGATTVFWNPTGAKLYDYIPPASQGTPETACSHGLRLFAESRGYGVAENYTQLTDNQDPPLGGFTFAEYMAEIDAGYPVMIHVTGHSMVGVGYDAATSKVYLHDTWDNLMHEMPWGGTYSDPPMAMQAVTVIHLDPAATLPPGFWEVNVGSGQTVQNVDFGNTAQMGEIQGRKWNDLDGDGDVGEPGETGLPGWTIYVDENQNGQWDGATTETLYDVTDVNGDYAIPDVPPGTHWVGEAPQSGWNQTFPSAAPGGAAEASQPSASELGFMVADSPPTPSSDLSHSVVSTIPPAAVTLSDVPTSRWTFGCTATSAGMIFGYYDRGSYPDMYTGPANGGVAPLTNLGQGIPVTDPDYPIPGSCSIIATDNGFDGRVTDGHVEDYWIGYGAPGPDPWEGGVEHTWGDCTADYLGTNQWKWDYDLNGSKESNVDGATVVFYDDFSGSKVYDHIPLPSYGLPQTACSHGLRLFAESRGYSVAENYSQVTDNQHGAGFTFAEYMAEIDAGHPVMLHIRSLTEGHSMVGMGYDTTGNVVYFHDTWDNSMHSMTWGGSYAEMTMQAVTVIHLDPAATLPPGFWEVPVAAGETVTGKDFGNQSTGQETWDFGDAPEAASDPASLLTTMAAGNGLDGNMFDITAINTVTIDSFDGHPDVNGDWKIYYKVGSYVGSETTPADWTLLGTATGVVAEAKFTPTPIPIPVDVTIPAGQTYAFYVTMTAAGHVWYTNGTAFGNVFASDANIQFKEGTGNPYEFGTPIGQPRVFNGVIHYSLSTPGYPTLLASNGARHVIAGPWLGDAQDNPDPDLDGQPTAAADGDDADGSDDEDGVTVSTLIRGETNNIPVEVSGVPGYLHAWVDFNADGDWDDADEKVHSAFLPTVGTHLIPIAVPAGAGLGDTYARFRITTAETLGADGTAADGEVEDYPVTIEDGPGEWTLMVYLDGDNNLEGAGIDDFLEMSSVGSDANINIVVLFDRIPGYDTTYDDWTDARQGRILPGDVPDTSWGASIGEVNMGDPNTLSTFVNWAIAEYPSSRYGLVLWDHGDGWRSGGSQGAKGACWDVTNLDDYLENREVGTALAAVPENLDLFGYDCCLMGMIEVAHEVKDEASVFIGSEDLEPLDGWPYDTFLPNLIANPTWDAAQLAADIVVEYGASYAGGETLSSVDLAVVRDVLPNGLSAAVSNLGAVIVADATPADYGLLRTHYWATPYFDYIEYRDLGTFLGLVAGDAAMTASIRTAAQTAQTAYNAAVLQNHSDPAKGGTGLSIYMQPPDSPPDADYNGTVIDFAADTQWDELLGWWENGIGPDLTGSGFAAVPYAVYGQATTSVTFEVTNLGAGVTPDAGPFDVEFFWSVDADLGNGDEIPADLDPSDPHYNAANPNSYQLAGLAGGASASDTVTLVVPPVEPFGTTGIYYLGMRVDEGTAVAEYDEANNHSQGEGLDLRLVHWLETIESFPLDTDPGWTIDPPPGQGSQWEFGDPLGLGGTAHGNPDPNDGFTGTNVYGVNLTGDYSTTVGGPYYLTTGPIDCTGYADVHLEFYRWLNSDFDTYVKDTVELSTDGSTWQPVWANGSSPITDSAWQHQLFDISAYADNQPALQVRWGYQVLGGAFAYSGWNVDDISILGRSTDMDFGDAPDTGAGTGPGNYQTLLADKGPQHLIVGPWLGPDNDNPDGEADGQQHPTALGDDTDGNDDEDGVSIPALYQGMADVVTVMVSGGGGHVSAWIDFNANGSWLDAGEQIFDGPLSDGVHPIPVNTPAAAVVGPTFARFRITTAGSLPPDGPAPDGEVEDHELQIYAPGTIEGFKWYDQNGDGVWDQPTEPPLAGWTIYVDENLNGQKDAGEPSDVTEADGSYSIGGLRGGTHVVAEEPQDGWRQTYPAGGGGGAGGAAAAFAPSSEEIIQWMDLPDAPTASPDGLDIDTAWVDGAGPSALVNLELSSLTGATASGVPVPGSGVYHIYVENGLLAGIQSSIDTYVADLTAEGYSVTYGQFTGDAAALRADLQSKYTTSSLEGAVFVGDLPYVDFTSEDDYTGSPVQVTYPHDLYFMDLDGTYVLNATGLDEHTPGTGDVGPEIYISRITTGNLGTVIPGKSEADLINEYFAKNHDYRSGALNYHNRGIVFADDDWDTWGVSEMELYSDVLAINTDPTTVKANYLSTLGLNRESILECIHSGATSHSLKVGSSWQSITNAEVKAANPRPGFYNMFNCSSALFTTANHLIGTYIYGGDYGLNAVGSAKTGSMLFFDDYYLPQGTGESVGEAFRQWFDKWAFATNDPPNQGYVDWFYGMTMQGDPTLKPDSMGDLPGTHSVNVNPGLTTADINFGNESTIDFGDAPDPTYPTLLASDGARHTIAGPWLGGPNDAPDGEPDGQPSSTATGDDLFDGQDDENGVTIPALIAGQTANITLEVSNGPGVVQAWIDFNGDGAWQDPAEKVFDGSLATGVHTIPVSVPAGPAVWQTFARFRISRLGGLGPQGAAADGEVEDYLVFVLPENTKWSQLPDLTSNGIDVRMDDLEPPTRVLADDFQCTEPGLLTDVHFWASHKLDELVDVRNVHLSVHTDDRTGDFSKPGELLWQMDFAPGQFQATLVTQLDPGEAEWWYDPWTGEFVWPGDTQLWRYDVLIDPADAFFQEGTVDNPQIYWLDIQIDTELGQVGWKTRQWPDHFEDDAVWLDASGAWQELKYPDGHPYHNLPENSIDLAYVLTFEPVVLDFGDAPDLPTAPTGPGDYETLLASNGPRHTIVPNLQMGAAVDPEPDGQPTVPADGDDLGGVTPDDEDGVIDPAGDLDVLIGLVPTVNVKVTNNTGSGTAATLYGWIDYNNNGVFENASERASVNVPHGSIDVTVTLTFPVVPAGFVGDTYARFRLSTDAAAANPTGAASDGEVEDYPAEVHARVVAGSRRIFYDDSYWDGNTAGANTTGGPSGTGDDGAVATDKSALLPGATATSANWTSYDKGINGIMVDVAGLANPTAVDDGVFTEFDFRYGNDSIPSGPGWTTAPAPTDVDVRLLPSGDYRVSFFWAAGAIPTRNWLQLTLKADDTTTGLGKDDIFYFGNAIGDANLDTKTLYDDIFAIYSNVDFVNYKLITDPTDINRDGKTLYDDIFACYSNIDFTNQLVLITPPIPPSAPGAGLAAPARAEMLWAAQLAALEEMGASSEDSDEEDRETAAEAVFAAYGDP